MFLSLRHCQGAQRPTFFLFRICRRDDTAAVIDRIVVSQARIERVFISRLDLGWISEMPIDSDDFPSEMNSPVPVISVFCVDAKLSALLLDDLDQQLGPESSKGSSALYHLSIVIRVSSLHSYQFKRSSCEFSKLCSVVVKSLIVG